MKMIQTDELVPEELVVETKQLGVQLWDWIQDQVLTIDTAVQLGVLFLALVFSFLLQRPVRSLITHLVEQINHIEPLNKWLQPAGRFFAPVLLSAIIFIALSAAQTGLQAYAYPFVLAKIGSSLAAAYFFIRLASGFITEPFWSRVLARSAWLVAALNIFGWLTPVMSFLDTPFPGGADGPHWSVLVILKGLFLAVALLWGASRSSILLRTRIQKLPSLTPSVQLLLSKAIQVTLMTAAILFALSSVGVDLKSLAIIGGALSFGIGFGLQRILANLISGIILLIDRSIKPGDVIEVDQTYGRVASLGLRYTSVVTRDRKEHLIPNESFVTGKVVNWSFSSPIVRIKQKIGIAYHSDVHKAIELAVAAATSIKRVLGNPAVVCQLREFGDSAVIIELRFWIRDSHNGIGNVSSEVLLRIWDSFHENNIDFPFPQRDVNLSSEEPIRVSVEPAPNTKQK